MKSLATSLVLALLIFTNPSASQQTAIITELPAYSSLSPCVASVVSSAALQFSNFWCSSTTLPVALASCICLNAMSSAAASDEISGGAEVLCTAAGSSDLRSALSVLTTYCDAASQGNASPTTPMTKPTTEGSLTETSNALSSTSSIAAGSLTETSNAISSTSSIAAGSTSTNTGISNPTSTPVSNLSSVSSSPSSSSPLQTGSRGGLSKSDKIAIATSVGIGVPATIAAIIGTYIQYQLYLAEKRRRTQEAAEARSRGDGAGIELAPIGGTARSG